MFEKFAYVFEADKIFLSLKCFAKTIIIRNNTNAFFTTALVVTNSINHNCIFELIRFLVLKRRAFLKIILHQLLCIQRVKRNTLYSWQCQQTTKFVFSLLYNRTRWYFGNRELFSYFESLQIFSYGSVICNNFFFNVFLHAPKDFS